MNRRDKIDVICSWLGDTTERAKDTREFLDQLMGEMAQLGIALESRDKEATEFELVKANQQLTGFSSAKDGMDIIDLVDSMGLKSEEWNELKKRFLIDHLGTERIQDIDEHFNVSTDDRNE